jgi:hypothetical protein
MLAGICGCLSFCHPVAPPTAEVAITTRCQPKCCRDHVYIFLIQGLDPLDFADLRGLRDYINELGFKNTYFGQLYHTIHFKHEMERIRAMDPECHFVLIGFSFGANMVRDLALAAQDAGVPIDLLIYLGGNTLDNTPHDRPANCLMVVNILASGCIWNGTWFDNAENFHLPDVWHFGSPTHKVTLEVLTRDLATVVRNTCAAAKPLPQPGEPELPMPRPAASVPGAADEWSFIKPNDRLRYDATNVALPETAGATPEHESWMMAQHEAQLH